MTQKAKAEKDVWTIVLHGTEATPEEEAGAITVRKGDAVPEEDAGVIIVRYEKEVGTAEEKAGVIIVPDEKEVRAAEAEEEEGAIIVREEEDVGAAEALAYEFKYGEPERNDLLLILIDVGEDQPLRTPPLISLDYVGHHHDNLQYEAIQYFIRRETLWYAIVTP